ncbi:sulfurtransferase [Burkholderia sp. PAMC 28687]|uniref:Rhodanese-related sulfurtransferase n=1 Tax=Caballeronia sordidicola TaxID=196367 RepID=A0A242NA47_CABSO|nr:MULTISPECIES: rhodanese homology domain-containing protein [Burkholderiaceae]AMM17432.1 sulfurtransferase [Burkholderia sp. PAMC 28687]OTP80026.1 Rhodanese-related sulfurtransferase [Caballeronia sordidicola]
MSDTPLRSFDDVRDALLSKREIAFLDVREEDPHAQRHPLFAANLPLSKIELDALTKLPRKSVPIVLIDDGEGLAQRAANRFEALGFSEVSVFDGGLKGWERAGGEVFRDVNVPSKAFGEFVEAKQHTPALSAEAVDALLKSGEDVVVLDARRYDEYQTMNIPGSISVPGAELVLRARALAPDPNTRVIVNCAGRTRSIIGTQSLVNAGLPNPVSALRNGTIGWLLAGQTLAHGSANQFAIDDGRADDASRKSARSVADRAGVKRTTFADAQSWAEDPTRTTYRFDVRTPAEYEHAHAAGFQGAPGGQLVQETEMFAPVRGARIVLFDDDGVRANMTASWLAQMNNDVHVIDDSSNAALTERGPWRGAKAQPSPLPTITAKDLAAVLDESASRTIVLDFTASANHVKGHIPGAWWAVRSRLPEDLPALPDAKQYVVTCASSALAAFAGPDVAALTGKPVLLLEGGTASWIAAGLPLEKGETHLASPRIDRYRRPYEGTDAPHDAMNAYLEWEYGLVAQLERDGTHGFFVI